AVLEFRDLLEHFLQALLFAFRRVDLPGDLRILLAERPVAPSEQRDRDDHNQAAEDHQLLAGLERRRGRLDLAFGREEVDPNHRSPAFRRARPIATAATGPNSSGLSTPTFFASSATWRNGSNCSTSVPKRSRRDSAKPSTRDAPPHSMMRSMR